MYSVSRIDVFCIALIYICVFAAVTQPDWRTPFMPRVHISRRMCVWCMLFVCAQKIISSVTIILCLESFRPTDKPIRLTLFIIYHIHTAHSEWGGGIRTHLLQLHVHRWGMSFILHSFNHTNTYIHLLTHAIIICCVCVGVALSFSFLVLFDIV